MTHDFSEAYFDPELWVRLQPKLRDELAQRSENILSGRVRNVEDYREQVGFVLGLRWALDAARELMRIEEKEEA